MARSTLTRLLAVAAALVALTALTASALAQPGPQHRFYGSGVMVDGEAAPAGTMISAWVDGAVVGSTTTDADGVWYIDVDGGQSVVFSVGELVAEGSYDSITGGQTNVSLSVMTPPPPEPEPDPCPEDGMMEDGMMEDDDAMMSEDDDAMMSEDGDSMMDGDAMLDCPEPGDEMDGMEEDDMDEQPLEPQYPAGGSGGLATEGGLSTGLIGLLAALALVAVSGAGFAARRLRHRA